MKKIKTRETTAVPYIAVSDRTNNGIMYNWDKYRDNQYYDYLESLNAEGSEYYIALYYALKKRVYNIDDNSIVMIEDAIEDNLNSEKIISLSEQINADLIIDFLKEHGVSRRYFSIDLGNLEEYEKVPEWTINRFKIRINAKPSGKRLAVDAKRMLPKEQIRIVKNEVLPKYAEEYLEEMEVTYRDPRKWFLRNRPSQTKDDFIDELRTIVIDNWKDVSLKEKKDILKPLLRDENEMIINFEDGGITIDDTPVIKDKDTASISLEKYGSARLLLTLKKEKLAVIEVGFAKDFLDTVYNKEGKRTSKKANIIYRNIEMVYGNPLGKWMMKLL